MEIEGSEFGFPMVDFRSLIFGLLFGLFSLLWSNGVSAAEPVRVVSLAPNLTELVYELGLGDRLVGRSSACDYPPAALDLPVVGGFGRPNMEALLRLKPDMVLATDLENPVALNALRTAGVRCLDLPCESWDQLIRAATAIGKQLGDPDAGATWAAAMQVRRERIESRVNERLRNHSRPSVYVEVWHDPITTVGGSSFVDDLVELAGGRNIGHDLKTTYPHVNTEWVIRENPDVILAADMLPGELAVERFQKRTGWGSISAVQTGRICDTIDPDLLLRSGPRVLDGAEAFEAWLWAPSGKQSE